jgi:hypothetical protein
VLSTSPSRAGAKANAQFQGSANTGRSKWKGNNLTQAVPSTVTIGARYRRPGEPKPVYRVAKMAGFHHPIPHVTLVSEAADRSITIGVGVLLDRRLWVPAE